MDLRPSVLCLLWAAAGLAAQNAGSQTPNGADLAEALRSLDSNYKMNLVELLRKARLSDDEAVVADIKARLAAIAKYRSKGLPKRTRTLTVMGSMKVGAELVVSRDGLTWRDPGSYGGPADITVNGVAWDVRWHNQQCTTPLKLPIGEIVSYKAAGSVQVKKIYRGPGVTGFKITAPGERTTFGLKIQHRLPVGE